MFFKEKDRRDYNGYFVSRTRKFSKNELLLRIHQKTVSSQFRIASIIYTIKYELYCLRNEFMTYLETFLQMYLLLRTPIKKNKK